MSAVTALSVDRPIALTTWLAKVLHPASNKLVLSEARKLVPIHKGKVTLDKQADWSIMEEKESFLKKEKPLEDGSGGPDAKKLQAFNHWTWKPWTAQLKCIQTGPRWARRARLWTFDHLWVSGLQSCSLFTPYWRISVGKVSAFGEHIGAFEENNMIGHGGSTCLQTFA